MTDAVASTRFPYLGIQVQIGSPQQIEQELSVEALVDAGFDGGALLPTTMIDPAIAPDTHLPWLLADGTEVLTPTYLASVHVGTLDPVVTLVIARGDEPLLGRDVTDHFRLIFDHGREVLVEP